MCFYIMHYNSDYELDVLFNVNFEDYEVHNSFDWAVTNNSGVFNAKFHTKQYSLLTRIDTA